MIDIYFTEIMRTHISKEMKLIIQVCCVWGNDGISWSFLQTKSFCKPNVDLQALYVAMELHEQ